MKRTTIIEIIAFLYTCLFLYTGIAKLQNYELGIEQNAVMPIVGPYTEIVTWALPLLEIVLAIILFIPKTKKLGLIAGTTLMLLFTGYVAYIMKAHSKLPCTCGGFLQELTWPQHLIFNSLFVLLGITALFLYRNPAHKSPNTQFTLSH